MAQTPQIDVVIPSFKVEGSIREVIAGIPDFISHVIVVDDACPRRSGNAAQSLNDGRVHVVFHETNQGVGGATISGYRKALELGADVVIKIDGDGQMDCRYMEPLIRPILEGKADYTKGNRFVDFDALSAMPRIRLMGNSALSFMVKAASGYWNIMDPTNGYTAISRDAIRSLPLERIDKRYFFESNMLIHLNIHNLVVQDVPIPAKYGEETSSLSITHTLASFPKKLFKGMLRRIWLKYFILDFNMASLYMMFGIPMVLFGSVFGAYRWIAGSMEHEINSAGTVMLAVVPIILGTQFLLQAIQIDMNNIPKKR